MVVVRAMEQFLADHAAVRCVVTSRPYGYIRLPGTIEHFLLGNFSDEQVEEFIDNWQRAFALWRHPQAPNLDGAATEAREMIDEIRKHEKVAELARNPLMLVIIALIRYEQVETPGKAGAALRSRSQDPDGYLDRWRSLPQISVGGSELPYERMVQVWGRVAEWTRREKPTGVVHREELRRCLIATLEDLEFDEEDPQATADSYLNAAVERAGLLEEGAERLRVLASYI